MSTKSRPKKDTTPQIIYTSPDDVKRVVALPDYCLEIEFFDGTQGKVLMKEMIFSQNAGVFTALRNPTVFNQVFINYGAVTWPKELDLAPDAMYAEIKKNGIWVLK